MNGSSLSLLRVVVLALFFFGISSSHVLAADLVFSPTTGTHPVGVPFTVTINAVGITQPINAVSGSIVFSPTQLSIRAVQISDSFLTLWPEKPVFSNTAGTLHFGAVIPNPGYQQSQGMVLRITFVPQRTGAASVSFNDGSILANDGAGTNVLGHLGGAATYTLSTAVPVPAKKEPIPAAVSPATTTSSTLSTTTPPTHSLIIEMVFPESDKPLEHKLIIILILLAVSAILVVGKYVYERLFHKHSNS